MSARQQPIEVIQARTLLATLATPAFLVDSAGTLLFFNDAAAELLGVRFDDVGPMDRDEWGSRFEPHDPKGRRVPVEELPLAIALRERRPGHAPLRIRGADGVERDIEVSAFPLLASGGLHGGVAIFWPTEGDSPAAG